MVTMTFDTLKFVERLKAAGLPEGQARAMAEAFREASEDLITKDYLRAELAGLEGRLRAELWKAIAAQTVVVLGVMAALKLWS